MILLGFFYWLNFYNRDIAKVDTWNVIVSGTQFVIVFLIFSVATRNFRRVNRTTKDLGRAYKTITESVRDPEDLLYDITTDEVTLFTDPMLVKQFDEYKQEYNRLKEMRKKQESGDDYRYDGYRCDVADYINTDLIDHEINRSVMNLIPGVMTGLGILGTFIGLSIALNSFTAEGGSEVIANSIKPLMDGIKVAFHTSIYGMVFSLVFNFAYKKKIGAGKAAIVRFLELYTKKVCPDTQNDNMNRFLALQEKQNENVEAIFTKMGDAVADALKLVLSSEFEKLNGTAAAIRDASDKTGDTIAQKVNEAVEPHFAHMDNTIKDFADAASQVQVDGMNAVVDRFMQQMNARLVREFDDLSSVMANAADIQKRHNTSMEEMFSRIDGLSSDLKEMSELTDSTVTGMAAYINRLNGAQESMSGLVASIVEQNRQNAESLSKNREYQQAANDYLQQIAAIVEEAKDNEALLSSAAAEAVSQMREDAGHFNETVKEQMSQIRMLEERLQTSTAQNVSEIRALVDEYCKVLAEETQRQIEEVQKLKEETSVDLTTVSMHMKAAASKLDHSMEDAFDRVSTGFDDVQDKLDTLQMRVDAYEKR